MDFPEWAGTLTHLYCCLRVGKRNQTLKRMYYRKIEKEKLRLAELGINQQKIKAVCRFLVNQDCVRGSNSKTCFELFDVWIKPDIQLYLRFY